MIDGRHHTAAAQGRRVSGRADSPWGFGWQAWKAVLRRCWQQTMADNIDLMAAGVAFYGFLALVPILGAIVLTYGLVATPDSVLVDFRVLTTIMPADAARLVRHELLTIITGSDSKKGLGLAVALALALFGARSGAGAVITALNLAYEERETRGFVRLNLIALALTAAGTVVVLAVIAAIAALAWVTALLPALPARLGPAQQAASWAAVMLVGGGIAAALYRIGPDRAPRGVIWLTPGAALAAGGWVVMTLGFGSYVANSDHYNATYGSLSAVVVILTWFYLSSYFLLVGAELNSECERQADLLGRDAGPVDAGPVDAGPVDAGVPEPSAAPLPAAAAAPDPSL